MLSLVQYSDESDNDDVDEQEEEGTTAIIIQNGKSNQPQSTITKTLLGEIEDDEYEAPPKLNSQTEIVFSKKLTLPAPKTVAVESQEEINEQNHINEEKEQRLGQNEDQTNAESNKELTVTEDLLHTKLPEPTKQIMLDIVEEEDEFLKKKAIPTVKPPPLPTIKPKGPVKITIPSLKDFKDVDDEPFHTHTTSSNTSKGSTLLSLLPKPRVEAMIDAKIAASNQKAGPSTASTNSQKPVRKVTSLVPDSVKRKAEQAAKAVRERVLKSEGTENKISDDSDDSDSETSNFFSFDQEDKLPEISTDEIAQMVAKRAAKIAETKSKVEQAMNPTQAVDEVEATNTYEQSYPMLPPSVDPDDLYKLQGGNRAKRAKVEEINFVEITDADIKPSREEFLRTHLAQQTQFVPTGNLVGYDSTSKRKSQITYLAQKALANEQELQALWAANRQKQRASSSKYGF